MTYWGKSKLKRNIALSVLCICSIIAGMFMGTEEVSAKDNNADVEILFTSDIHSYLAPYATEIDGQTTSVGGMSRVATFVREKRMENPELLLFDGGDYPMGTLYQTLYSEEAFEYRMLSKIGFDATTFGNHDFDYGSEGLASQFESAKANVNEEDYPYYLTCNVNWENKNPGTKVVYDVLKDMKLKDYVIFERNGLKIGVTGVLGYDALDCAPTCELEILDPIESVKNTVAKMKEESNPDMIVLLSHSGTDEDPDKSEDEIIAKEVPDIDFILSGHSHTVIPEVIKIGDTYIGSCGCYCEYVGEIALSKNENGRFDLVKYDLHKMDSSVDEDPEIADMLKGFDDEINKKYLKAYGYGSDYILAHNSYEFSTVDDVYFIHDDHNLGNLMADAYRWRVNSMTTDDPNTVVASVAPAGTIRATYPRGNINVAKVYESFSLGCGADGTVGYPLVSVYLTGEELSTLCEVDATVSALMHSATLYFSGIKFEYNPNRAFLNKVTNVWLNSAIDAETLYQPDPEKLYRVVTDVYSFRMLGTVKKTSKGLLNVEPKDINGNPVVNEEDIIVHDENGNEVKAWVAIANYMSTFEKNEQGVPEFPKMYENGKSDRKVVKTSKSVVENVKSPNKFFFAFYVVILIVVALFLFPILMFIKKSREKNKRDELLEEKEKLLEYVKEKENNGDKAD